MRGHFSPAKRERLRVPFACTVRKLNPSPIQNRFGGFRGRLSENMEFRARISAKSEGKQAKTAQKQVYRPKIKPEPDLKPFRGKTRERRGENANFVRESARKAKENRRNRSKTGRKTMKSNAGAFFACETRADSRSSFPAEFDFSRLRASDNSGQARSRRIRTPASRSPKASA